MVTPFVTLTDFCYVYKYMKVVYVQTNLYAYMKRMWYLTETDNNTETAQIF